jgi:hypothetical protein
LLQQEFVVSQHFIEDIKIENFKCFEILEILADGGLGLGVSLGSYWLLYSKKTGNRLDEPAAVRL